MLGFLLQLFDPKLRARARVQRFARRHRAELEGTPFLHVGEGLYRELLGYEFSRQFPGCCCVPAPWGGPLTVRYMAGLPDRAIHIKVAP